MYKVSKWISDENKLIPRNIRYNKGNSTDPQQEIATKTHKTQQRLNATAIC